MGMTIIWKSGKYKRHWQYGNCKDVITSEEECLVSAAEGRINEDEGSVSVTKDRTNEH